MRVLTPFKRAIVLGMLLASTGCATSGRNFHADPLAQLVPGHTTLPEAVTLMRAYPVQTYATKDGEVDALWSYQVTSLDHLLYRKSALLRFGPDGTFDRVVETGGFVRNVAPQPSQPEPVQNEHVQKACGTSAAVCR